VVINLKDPANRITASHYQELFKQLEAQHFTLQPGLEPDTALFLPVK
jgi:hypothetical protein